MIKEKWNVVREREREREVIWKRNGNCKADCSRKETGLWSQGK